MLNLTHWGRDKMAVIFQTTFSNGFSWMKMYEFRLTFHWSLFLGVQLTIFQHWFRKWLGADQATSHYLNQWWLDNRRIHASLCLNELNCYMHAHSFPIPSSPSHDQFAKYAIKPWKLWRLSTWWWEMMYTGRTPLGHYSILTTLGSLHARVQTMLNHTGIFF